MQKVPEKVITLQPFRELIFLSLYQYYVSQAVKAQRSF